MGCMERTRDEMLQAAEAEAGRIHEVLLKLEAERDAAMERLNQIAGEPFDTPEEEAELSRRVEIIRNSGELKGRSPRLKMTSDAPKRTSMTTPQAQMRTMMMRAGTPGRR